MDTLGGFGCHRLCIGVTRAVGKLTAGHAGAGAAVARAAVIAVTAGCAVAGPTAALTRGSGATVARAAVIAVAAGAALAVTAGAAALYALFYPVLVGIQIPSWYGTCLLRWLPSWPF